MPCPCALTLLQILRYLSTMHFGPRRALHGVGKMVNLPTTPGYVGRGVTHPGVMPGETTHANC